MYNTPYCLTTTIDNYSNIGDRYYHNIDNTIVKMRPRIPLRYDFNDISIIKLPTNESNRIKRNYRYSDRNLYSLQTDLYRFKRTTLSIVNTFLLYFLVIMLMITSFINMRKTLTLLQEDTSLSRHERLLFRIGFILSFVVVFFLSCYIVLSLYELYRNLDKFPLSYIRDNVRYKTLVFPDGKYMSLRFIILFFVLVCIILSTAEVFNLFFMETQPQLLFIFIPILTCFILLVSLYVLHTNNN